MGRAYTCIYDRWLIFGWKLHTFFGFTFEWGTVVENCLARARIPHGLVNILRYEIQKRFTNNRLYKRVL